MGRYVLYYRDGLILLTIFRFYSIRSHYITCSIDITCEKEVAVVIFTVMRSGVFLILSVLGKESCGFTVQQEFVRPRWPYDMRPSARAEKYIRDAGP